MPSLDLDCRGQTPRTSQRCCFPPSLVYFSIHYSREVSLAILRVRSEGTDMQLMHNKSTPTFHARELPNIMLGKFYHLSFIKCRPPLTPSGTVGHFFSFCWAVSWWWQQGWWQFNQWLGWVWHFLLFDFRSSLCAVLPKDSTSVALSCIPLLFL